MNAQKITKLIITAIFLAVIFKLPVGSAQSSPVFWITWTTDSYAPNSYEGKILPANSANVSVSFELFENGKPLNLSNQEVRWFMNNVIAAKGVGLKTFAFAPGGAKPAIRVELPSFRGGASLAKSISIPIADPEIIINMDNAPSAGKSINLRALPYFFNIKNITDLSFNWKINSASPEGSPEDPSLLTIVVPEGAAPGDKIIAEVTAEVENSLERASARKILTVFSP